MLTREEFQQLAKERLADVKAMIAAKRWSLAYYAAGYVAEYGLKACILARVSLEAGLIFEDRRFSEKCWTHNLEELLRLAGLRTTFNADAGVDPELLGNWGIVIGWTEASRYARTQKARAEAMYDALADKKHGVLQWIKRHW